MLRKDILAEVSGYESRSYGGHDFRLPVLYRRLDCFFAVCSADREAVGRLLPSDRLRPLPVRPGRCLLALNAFNYLDTDLGPYGEFSVGVPCLLKRPGRLPASGIYIHRLPVTEELAMVAGIEEWGYPKFTCDMEFENTGMRNAVRLSHQGNAILELAVKKSGPAIGAAVDLNTFTVKDGNIITTLIRSSSMVRFAPFGKAELHTGDHEMGRELAGLSLGRRPLVTGDLLDANMLLPPGENSGPA